MQQQDLNRHFSKLSTVRSRAPLKMASELKISHPHVQLDITPILPTELLNSPELFTISNGELIAFHLVFLPFVNMIPAAYTRFRENVTQFAEPDEQELINETESEKEFRNFLLSAKYRRSAVQYIEVGMTPTPKNGRWMSQTCSIASPHGCETSFKASLEHWREVQKLIQPSTIVVLHPAYPDADALKESLIWYASTDDRKVESQPTTNNPVFVMDFSKIPSSNSSKMLRVPLKGHLMCEVCENSAAEVNRWARSGAYKFNIPRKPNSVHNFECNGKELSSCWPTMSWTLEGAAQGGRSVFWKLKETTITSLHTYCVTNLSANQNPTRKPILGSWTIANQMDYTLSLGSNFSASFDDFGCYSDEISRRLPKEHVFDSASLASHRVPARYALLVSINAELGTDRMENFVHVSEVDVESSNSAIDLYLNPMEAPVWYALTGAFLIGCATFATLSSFESRIIHGGEKWAWRHWALRFAQILRYLGGLFVDQCHLELPIRQRTTVVVSIVLPWLLAILIATNGFKSFFKARFLLPFPYKLVNKTSWQDFVGYSFYAIDDPTLDCNCSYNGRNIGFDPNNEVLFLNKVAQYGAGMGDLPIWICERCMRGNTPVQVYTKTYLEHLRPSYGKATNTFTKRNQQWHKQVMQKLDAAQRSGNQAEINSITFKALEKISSWLTIGHAERICRHCLDAFVGPKYRATLEKHKARSARLEAAGYNMSFASFVGEKRVLCQTKGENATPEVIDLFWASREYKAVFVIPATQFPWLWNLFKIRMKADPRLKFAYIGPKQLKTRRVQLLDSNPTNSHTYIERQFQHETWMARRIAALHTSGLLDFWNKWYYINRINVKGVISTEVDEQDKEFKPLAVTDPSLKLLFAVVYTTLLSLIAILALEILVSMVHLASARII